ncbi:hypothetical protein V2J52_02775 [Georgenia sp. MJ173]|uniref:hypothetical protein n=1 Tax=Georgenia sunbinii TaxID=3117728 RepID=UPI002F2629BF
MDDRPVWWFDCDGGPSRPHDPTPLGGLMSAHNDPWPARQEAHQELAARVLGHRFEAEEPIAPSGGLWAVKVYENRRASDPKAPAEDWQARDHVKRDGGQFVLRCPTCRRRQQVPIADLQVSEHDGVAHLRVRDGSSIPSGSTLTIGRLDR